MKLWIIYKEGLIISKVIAEMIQDRLENYIDVSVGKASMITPSIIVEEEVKYLIIVDITNKAIPSVEIKDWVLECANILIKDNLQLEAISGFLITLNEVDGTLWEEFIHKNILTQTIYPPILCLSLNNSDFAFETNIYKIVKEYSNQFTEFILKE